jgi:N-acyl-D-aspartate/D-glutamate deacylase
VNLLSYVGLNPLMSYVMGLEAAKSRPANDTERAEMCALLDEAMAAGACGFSAQVSGQASVQRDFDGTPMITDTMSEADIVAFCEVLGRLGRGTVQMAGSVELAARIARASGRPVIWNVLAAATDQHGAPATAHEAVIGMIDRANKVDGLRIFAQALTVDVRFEFTLEEWNLFDSSALWRDVTLGTVEERLAKMSDPQRRAALRDEYDAGRGPVAGGGTEERDVRVGTGISELLVEWVSSDAPQELKRYEGHTVGEIAALDGVHPVDAMLDLAVASRLRTGFATPVRSTNVESMRRIVNSDYALPGVSDGGAHTKFITLGAYPTEFLTKWVRTHELLSLEDAHWRLSGYPAMAAGFQDRGWIKEGAPADIVVYDFAGLRELPAERAFDYPAGAWRLIKKAEGYRYTIVNGDVTFEDGVATGATPGLLLRHGTTV